jgi:hypothetical protein
VRGTYRRQPSRKHGVRSRFSLWIIKFRSFHVQIYWKIETEISFKPEPNEASSVDRIIKAMLFLFRHLESGLDLFVEEYALPCWQL